MTEARVQYKKAADQGHMEAQYNLAKMLREGEGGPVNMDEARVQYKKAADQDTLLLSTTWRTCFIVGMVDL